MAIHSECDLFILQIHAFLDNYFDVGQLLEDSETKQQAIGKVSELEEQLAIVRSMEMKIVFLSNVFLLFIRLMKGFKSLKMAIRPRLVRTFLSREIHFFELFFQLNCKKH